MAQRTQPAQRRRRERPDERTVAPRQFRKGRARCGRFELVVEGAAAAQHAVEDVGRDTAGGETRHIVGGALRASHRVAAASLHGISSHGSRGASERRRPKTCGAGRPAPSDCVCRPTRKRQNPPPVARPPTLPLSGIRRRRRPSGRSRKRTPAAPSATTSRRAPSRGKSTGAAASIQLVTAIGKSTDSPRISSALP